VTWFNALQIVLAGGAGAIIVRRMRALLFEAPIDAKPFLDALKSAIDARQFALARQIADACAPAWPACLASRALAELERAGADPVVVEETLSDLEAKTWQGLGTIVALGRIASPLSFIGVILEIGGAFSGGGGLEALQRGVAASRALERSLFTFALGVGTFAVCFAAATILQRRARRLRADLSRVASLVAQPGGQ
jgi:hypothetical protein